MAEISLGDVTARLRAVDENFTRTMAAAQQQLQGLQQTSQQTSTALAQMTQQATQQAQQFSSVWRQTLGVAAGLGIATSMTALIQALRNLAVESVNLASRMEGLNLAFKAIDGSASAANSTLTFLFTTAQRLGVPFENLAESFKRMDQAAKGTSLQGEGIRRVFEQVATGARALGVSSENVSHALVALEQIITKGKLSAEEYRRQLGNAIPGALQLMAQGFGVTTQVMEQMVASGIIPANAAVIALAESMGKLGGGQEPINRISATFARLANETKAWMAALGEGLAQQIKPFLDSIVSLSEKLRELYKIPLPGTTSPATTGGVEPMAIATSPYSQLIVRQAQAQSVDPGLLSQIIRAESNFNPAATSPKGAIGLGQLMLGTAQGIEPGIFSQLTEAQVREPETNVRLAAKYLSQLIDTFKNFTDGVSFAVAAYNAGPRRVMEAIQATRTAGEAVNIGTVGPRLPQETQGYLATIFGTSLRPSAALLPPATPQAQGGAAAPAVLDELLKGVEKTLQDLPQLNKQFDALTQSSLNFGGILGDALVKQGDDAVKKFTEMAELLARFPDLLEKMTPAQRERVELAAKEVAIFQRRVADEVQSEGEAQKRIQALRQIERLQEQIAEASEREMTAWRKERLQTLDIFGLELAPEDEAARRQFQDEERRRRQEQIKQLDVFGLELSPEQEASRQFTKKLQDQLQILQTPRYERASERLRAGAPGQVITPEQEALLEQIKAQERLNEIIRVFESLGNAVGSAWTNALSSIANGTQSVAQAFRSMAQSILQSLAQIASQEAFKALIRVGVGLIGGAFAGPAAAPATGAGETDLSLFASPTSRFQQGGIVNRPTIAMLGENPSSNPEYILNRNQMASLMQRGPSAGGQAVSIHMYDSRQAAEMGAAASRQAGDAAIVQAIERNLARGSSSSIGKLIELTRR